MAVKFRKNLSSLVRDLSRGGFGVKLVDNISGGRGRHADVHLYNNVVVSWDPHSKTVWAEGPHKNVERVERYLRGLYEKRGLKRACVTGYFMATRFIREPFHRLKSQWRSEKSAAESLKPTTVTPMSGKAAAVSSESIRGRSAA
jgi:hypothetical protein